MVYIRGSLPGGLVPLGGREGLAGGTPVFLHLPFPPQDYPVSMCRSGFLNYFHKSEEQVCQKVRAPKLKLIIT
jgi:hypothetical protein